MPPQGRSWDAPGGPRAARSRPKASPGRPRDAPRASGTTPKTLVTPFASPNGVGSACGWIFDRLSVDARKLRSVFRIGFYDVFSMSDVLRIDRSLRGKTSKKQLSWARKSRLGASRGHSEEQVRAQKRPSRAKMHARSAFGASENFLVSANEATSSEKARPVPPRSERAPEHREGKFRNLRMDNVFWSVFGVKN